MPRHTAPLSARKVESARTTEKPVKLFDGGGLYLLVTKTGKNWKLKYRYGGRECKLSLGAYPAVSLEMARRLRQEARVLLADGIDPMAARKSPADTSQAPTLEAVVREWYSVSAASWSKGHSRMVMSRVERYIIPTLGCMPISDVTAKDILASLRLIEAAGHYETSHRVRSIISQVYVFALVSGVAGVTGNPAAGLGRVLRSPNTRHMSAILDADEFSVMLKDSNNYPGSLQVKCALRLAPLLFVRPGELRKMQWAHLSGERWVIPGEEMKMRNPHIVPLSRQSLAILEELRPLTGHGKYVFAGRDAHRPMSENTVNMALRTMGWGPEKVTGHGFRATARTMLHETLGFSPDAIEAQLAHAVPDRLGAAYNRSQHLEERVRMMQAWADYLDDLKRDKGDRPVLVAKVVSLY